MLTFLGVIRVLSWQDDEEEEEGGRSSRPSFKVDKRAVNSEGWGSREGADSVGEPVRGSNFQSSFKNQQGGEADITRALKGGMVLRVCLKGGMVLRV